MAAASVLWKRAATTEGAARSFTMRSIMARKSSSSPPISNSYRSSHEGSTIASSSIAGFKSGPDAAKIGLALALTFALYSRWPVSQPAPASMVQLTGWMLAEAGIGLATGLAVSFIIEWLVMAAQAISTQAGFAYASTIDPNTEADATVLILIAQMVAGMLFFAMGLDRQLLGILSRSLETNPPAEWKQIFNEVWRQQRDYF